LFFLNVVNVCQTVSRCELEATYGILLPKPTEEEDATRCPTAYELLTAYACKTCLLFHTLLYNLNLMMIKSWY